MTRSQWENLLLTSTLVRNVCCAAVLSVVAGFMLYQLVTPEEERPALPSNQGGIPVVSLANAPANGFPGIPMEVINALVDEAQKTIDSVDSEAKRFVSANVRCNNGLAWVAVSTRDAGIEQVSFVPFLNKHDAVTAITCGPTGYQSNGQPLTDLQLAVLAIDGAQQSQ